MASSVPMDDMDIDFDVDPEIARLNAEAEAINASTDVAETMNGVEEAPEEGEVDSNAPVLHKVHIRGLNNLNTNHVKQFAEEHYSLDLFKNVEWVDDTSANLIYDTELAAAEALAEFSSEEVTEPLQLRLAKRLSIYPEVELFVRQAIVADVKAPNAKAQSRFYLINPDWDPENRPRKRGRPDDGYQRYSNKYRRREYDDDRQHRRGSREVGQFHEDMYDEGAKPPTGPRRRDSYPSDSEHGRRKVNYGNAGEDLLPQRSTGRLRDRSASPARDGDGRYGFSEEHPRRHTPRPRSRTPPGIRAGKDNRGMRDNLRRELFADRRPGSALANGGGDHAATNHDRPRSSSNSGVELFPEMVNGANHRRQVARDLHPDEVADAIGRRPEQNGRDQGESRPRDLFDRIDGGPQATFRSDRSEHRPAAGTRDGGFNIRGASVDAGFNIRGASRQEPHPLVRELFPSKSGTRADGGEDLMEGRLNMRGPGGRARRRAEDMF